MVGYRKRVLLVIQALDHLTFEELHAGSNGSLTSACSKKNTMASSGRLPIAARCIRLCRGLLSIPRLWFRSPPSSPNPWAGESPGWTSRQLTPTRGIPPGSAPIALATPGAFGKVRVEVGSGAPDCRPHRPSPSPTRERERDKMTRWGADVKPEDRPEVTDFLTSHVQAAQVSYYTIRRAAPRPG